MKSSISLDIFNDNGASLGKKRFYTTLDSKESINKWIKRYDDKQKNYEYTLKDSRQGVNLNTTELYELAHIICPLIKQGQSIYTILQNHKEITQCVKTIYTYIEMGLFKDWGGV